MTNIIEFPQPEHIHTLDEFITYLEEVRKMTGDGTLKFGFSFSPEERPDFYLCQQIGVYENEDTSDVMILGILD